MSWAKTCSIHKIPSWRKKKGWSCSSTTIWFLNVLPTQKIIHDFTQSSTCWIQTNENYTSTKDSEQCYFLAPFPRECALKSGIQLSVFRWIYLQSLVCNLILLEMSEKYSCLKLKHGIKIRPIKDMCPLDSRVEFNCLFSDTFTSKVWH